MAINKKEKEIIEIKRKEWCGAAGLQKPNEKGGQKNDT